MSQLAPDLPRTDRFRITAGLSFFPTHENGRKSPVASDYRTPCWFGARAKDGKPMYSDVFWYFREGEDTFVRDGTVWVPPGGTCTADGLVAFPAYLRPLAHPGLVFEVWEGRTVAKGTIMEVFDPGADAD